MTRIATTQYADRRRDDVTGSGYCVASLDAALWCVHHTRTFEAAVLAAANLGDDADTTAAITGQVAGALYGASGIPTSWLRQLHQATDIDVLAARLFDSAQGAGGG